MSQEHRYIFRAKALRHYLQGREANVLPRLVPPRILLLLWILFGLLVAGGFTLGGWGLQIPVYVTGTGFITEAGSPSGEGNTTLRALIFLPSNEDADVKTGQIVNIQLVNLSKHYTGMLDTINSQVLSPDEIRREYAVERSIALAITRPSIVVIAHFEAIQEDSQYMGGMLTATVQVGSQKIIPFLNRAFPASMMQVS